MMQFFGLKPEDYPEDAVEVFPDNVQALNLLITLGTQWRASHGGVYGLDYGVLYQKMDRMGLTPARYAELEEEIRVLEGAALDAMHAES